MENEMTYESKFLQGLAKLPFVASITDKLTEVYSSTKDCNEVLKITLEIAETVVKCGAECVKPLIGQLEEDIDNIAYEQLKKLEANYPFIALPPAVILECSKYAIDEVKTYGLKTADIVKSYYENFQHVKAYGWSNVFTITNYREKNMEVPEKREYPKDFVNREIEMVTMNRRFKDGKVPEDQSENSEMTIIEKRNNNLKRLTILAHTAHSRQRCAALDQLEKLKRRAENIMEELKAVLYCLQHNVTSYTLNCNKYVQNLWQEIHKENGVIQSYRHAKLLEKAKLLTKTLNNIFKQATSILTYLSTSSKQRFMEGTEEASNLWNSFKLASVAGEMTEIVFQHTHENVKKLEKVIASYWNLRFLTVPNLNFFTSEPLPNLSADVATENLQNATSNQT